MSHYSEYSFEGMGYYEADSSVSSMDGSAARRPPANNTSRPPPPNTTILPPILQSEDGPVQHVLTCTLCCEIPMEPVITPVCQHLFCRPCIKQALRNRQECPNDRHRLQLNQLKDLDGALRRIWECVPVRCPKAQCQWNGTMGSYAEHARNCISTLEEDFERRIKELEDTHAEQVEEMQAKLVSLEQRYETNLERTIDRIKQMHDHDIKEAVELARLHCKKDYEHQIKELKEEVHRSQSAAIKQIGRAYDRSNIAELLQVITRDIVNKPADAERHRFFRHVQGCFHTFDNRKRDTDPDATEALQLRVLVTTCRLSTWFSVKQRARFDNWCHKYNW